MSVRFGIVGYGAITEEMVRTLAARGELGQVAGVLVRPNRLSEAREHAGDRLSIFSSVEKLLAEKPPAIAECAGHSGVADYGAQVLGAGVSYIVSSVGALADDALRVSLLKSRKAKAQLLIPSGAIAGIDGLLAARTAGLQRVTYTSAKPPIAWNGTPAEGKLRGESRGRRVTFFEGSAREAALLYPKNVNIGAAVAFAGIGLDRTIVKMVSDPALDGPLGTVEAEGEFGTFRFDVLAYASPRNPKTSLLTAHSMLAAAREGVCFPLYE